MYLINILFSAFYSEFLNYYICNFLHLTKYDSNKIMSSLHAIIMAISSYNYLNNKITVNFYIEFLLLSVGYCIYDINNVIRINLKNKKELIFHHILLILCILGTIYDNNENIFHLLGVNIFSEISTTFLNVSIYLYETNRYNNIFFKFNAFLLVVTYLFFRVLSGFYCILFLIKLRTKYLIPQIIMTYMNINWLSKLILKYKSLKIKV